MPNASLGHRLAHLYALLSGSIGLFVLVRLFGQQTQPVDLATLLSFALIAVIVSTFRVPIGQDNGQVGLDGAVLLGATLAGGPTLGGWVSFITGLMTSILPPHSRTNAPEHWADSVSTALLNGGRNVIATSVSWWAFRGLEGQAAPASIDITQTLAVIVLCVTFAIVRSVWLWPIAALRSSDWPKRSVSRLANINDVLVELLPLPIALLTAATFVRLGWSFFLLLVYVFIGLGALMRQMLVRMHELQDHIETIELNDEIRQAIAQEQPEVGALCVKAHHICQQLVPARKFELGLFEDSYTSVNIQVSVNDDVKLPPMHIPITPQWEWLSEREAPHLVLGEALLAQLPFSLPPIGEEQAPQAAMFVPIVDRNQAQEKPEAAATTIGGIVLLSPQPNAFSDGDMARIVLVADQVGLAIHKARQT